MNPLASSPWTINLMTSAIKKYGYSVGETVRLTKRVRDNGGKWYEAGQLVRIIVIPEKIKGSDEWKNGSTKRFHYVAVPASQPVGDVGGYRIRQEFSTIEKTSVPARKALDIAIDVW